MFRETELGWILRVDWFFIQSVDFLGLLMSPMLCFQENSVVALWKITGFLSELGILGWWWYSICNICSGQGLRWCGIFAGTRTKFCRINHKVISKLLCGLYRWYVPTHVWGREKSWVRMKAAAASVGKHAACPMGHGPNLCEPSQGHA